MKFGNAQHSSCLAGQYLSKMYVWCHWCIQSREIKAQATCLRSPTVTAWYEGGISFWSCSVSRITYQMSVTCSDMAAVNTSLKRFEVAGKL